MKYLLPILLSLSVLCNSSLAAEYGILTINPVSNYHNNISSLSELDSLNYVILEEGDVIKFTYLYPVNSNLWYFRFAYGTEHSDSLWEVSHSIQFPSVGDEIPGPCIIFIDQNGSTSAKPVFAYKITRVSQEILTSNMVTLPSVNGLDWAVTLEQSTDLANWTAVAPGSVTGTDSLQFYRVRVTSNASSGE